MKPDPRPTVDAPDDDPHLWLEDIQGDEAVKWVDAQSEASLEQFRSPKFNADRDALAKIADRDDKIPYITRNGDYLYNFWKDAKNIRGVWRRTTMESYRSTSPEWETLLDYDRLAKTEQEDWTWAGSRIAKDGSGRVILRLSRGGSDAVVLREFDLTTKDFVEDGFFLEQAKSMPQWLDGDTLIVCSPFGDGHSTVSGYGRTARKWKRGQKFEDAEVIFETPETNMALQCAIDRTSSEIRLWFFEYLDFVRMNQWVQIGDKAPQKLNLPPEIWNDCHGDWLAVSSREEWTIEGTKHPAGSILLTSLSDLLSGIPEYQLLFTPTERRSHQGLFWNNDQLVITILDNLRPVIELYEFNETDWACKNLDGLPEIGVVHVGRLDSDETAPSKELIINCETPLTPPQLLLSDGGSKPYLLKQAPETFSNKGLVVSRHEATSTDGTLVPYFQIGPEQQTGNAPVHMFGYGGFQVSQLPSYRSSTGKLWLEQGGTCVIACIRGGGEFGPEWHKAGIRERKRQSHDDFAAIADDLVKRGVTVPKRIAAEAGSNGGILITNMLTRYPERFGALFCTIPLIDMRRYSKLLAGNSWIAEYGDPDIPEDWKFLKSMSAYHTAEPGKDYPPILIATTRLDDRVHPGHARKMTAKLQAMGYDALLYEADAGGHSYGKDSKEQATFTTLGIEFLKRGINWANSDELK